MNSLCCIFAWISNVRYFSRK